MIVFVDLVMLEIAENKNEKNKKQKHAGVSETGQSCADAWKLKLMCSWDKYSKNY